jgi:DNA-binding transcriptional MerR regulator
VADGSLRCGELAHLTGVSPDTIRHYERIGILPESPRTSGGYRMYGKEAVDRVRLVRRALLLGFTLAELSEILKVRDGGGVPCQLVLTSAEEKLYSLEQEINELRSTQRYMKQLVRQWHVRLGRTEPGHKAMLLESLADRRPVSADRTRYLRRRKEHEG